MRFPVVRERVRVQGRNGTFFVLAVHRERNVVDLVSTAKGGQLETDVPISSILRLTENGTRHDHPEHGQRKGDRKGPGAKEQG
jgi:hypothetical protein